MRVGSARLVSRRRLAAFTWSFLQKLVEIGDQDMTGNLTDTFLTLPTLKVIAAVGIAGFRRPIAFVQ